MSISYTKRGWTNNSPPAINAANLGAMDDALKLTADKVDTIAEGADVTATALASAIEGGTPTTTPDDTDKIPGVKSDHSRLYYTWANIKTALGSVFAPLTHASRHQHGGADEIATATPAANAIPKSNSTGKLDAWVSDASASTKGKVQLAVASELVTGTDDTKAPTAKQLKDATALDGFWLTKRTKMPDGATAEYSQDAWLTADGFVTSIAEGTLTTSNGILRYVRGATNAVYVRKNLGEISKTMRGKLILFRYRASKSCNLYFGGYSNGLTLRTLAATTDWQIGSALCTVSGSGNENYPAFWMHSDTTSGDWFEIDWLWIGNYSYLTGSLSEEAVRIANELGDTPGTPVAATATITASDVATATNGDTIAGKKYTYVAALTASPGVEGEVLKGATKEDDLENLNLAISETARTNNGTKYWAAAVHPLVSSTRNSAVLTLTARSPGLLGNQITTVCEAGTNHTASGSTLSGGKDAVGEKIRTQVENYIAGSGTRPAAAKIDITSTSLIGYEQAVDVASGGTLTLPAGGTWVWFVYGHGATISSAKRGSSAGGTTLTVAGANATVWYRRFA